MVLQDIFNAIIADPNIIYSLCILGLWVGITAVYIPGTGIPEITGGIMLVVGLLGLASLSVNWLAMAAIVLGLSSFLILPFLLPRWTKYAEVGLILQLFGSLYLFQDQTVSPALIALFIVIGIAYHRLVLIPIMRTQQAETDDPLDMIGLTGRVTNEIDNIGTVFVGGESWSASSHEPLMTGTPVIVVEQNGLELVVEKAKRENYQ